MKSRGRSNKLVGQIGEFLLCAHVARTLDLIATPFSGNVPGFDVIVADAHGRCVPIQVKTANGGDWPFDVADWVNVEFDRERRLQRLGRLLPLTNARLLHAFVWLAPAGKGSDRFFVVPKRELQRLVVAENRKYLRSKGGRRPQNWESTRSALRLPDVAPFEDRWDLIREQLAAIAK